MLDLIPDLFVYAMYVVACLSLPPLPQASVMSYRIKVSFMDLRVSLLTVHRERAQ